MWFQFMDMKEKYQEILNEVLDEIDTALKDSKGIVSHQRRLAFCLSLGTVNLLEAYLDETGVLKSGAKINHLWLKKKSENVKQLIQAQITSPAGNLEKINRILEVAYKIEIERNKLAYGKNVSEAELKEKINLFLDLKKELGK